MKRREFIMLEASEFAAEFRREVCSRSAKEDEASGHGPEHGARDGRHVNLCKIIHANRSRTGRREINNPVLDEGAVVIDPHHHAPAVTLVRYEHDRTERQRLVGGSQGACVDLLAVGDGPPPSGSV